MIQLKTILTKLIEQCGFVMSKKGEPVRFAVGTGFFTGQYDLDEAMHYADEQMYQDKEEYYRQHPEKNRRK